MSNVVPAGGLTAKLKHLESLLFSKRLPGEQPPDLKKAAKDLTDLALVYQRGGLSDDAGRTIGGCWMKMAKMAVTNGFSEEIIEQAYHCLNQAKKVHLKLLGKNPDDLDAVKRAAATLTALADLVESRGMPGDHHEAYALHQEGMALREGALKRDPSSVEAAREVVFGLNKLADFLFRRRQPEANEQALQCYRRDLEVCEQMLKHHQDSLGTARDVAFSANKLADFYMKHGEFGDENRAIGLYRRALEVCERSLEMDPQSSHRLRDVSIAVGKLATALRKRGHPTDREEVLESWERVVDLRRKIQMSESHHALAAADLAQALKMLALVVSEQGGEHAEARSFELFQQSLILQEQLLKSNPHSLDAARDAAVANERMGDLCFKRHSSAWLDKGIVYQERALALRERILRVDPNSLRAAAEISVSLVKTSAQLKRRGAEGDYDRALKLQQLNVEMNERLYASHAGAAKVARHLTDSLEMLAASLQQRGHEGDAPLAVKYRKRRAEVMAEWLKDEAAGTGTTERLGHGLVNIASTLLDMSEPEAIEQALQYCQQAVEVNEKRCQQENDSEESLRELAASLGAMADCLEKRANSEDEDQILHLRRRSVEMMERLALMNYGEPMPSREWLVALEGLARAVGRGGTMQAAAEAMGLQTRALDIGLKLAELYPDDSEMRRTVAVTLYLTHECALAAGDGEHADRCLDICHELLKDSLARGMEFDEPLMELFRQLEAT